LSDRYPTDAEKRRRWEREQYKKNRGRDPETRFPEDPDWQYRGSKAEREAMEERFGFKEEPVVIEGQEELFDA